MYNANGMKCMDEMEIEKRGEQVHRRRWGL